MPYKLHIFPLEAFFGLKIGINVIFQWWVPSPIEGARVSWENNTP
jgi:hypothetical protein